MSSHTLPAAGRRWLSGLQYTALGLAVALGLAACNKDGDNGAVALLGAPAQPAPERQPVAYQPPAPEVLYRMVAPIALYPDKLVAQILAASTYPDQVGAAESWLGQNPGLKPAELALAANDQPWDPAVKSLTQFPNVLEQMASNLPWTTALGKAYYNDPADVMNAIQVMRGRAYSAGSLKSSDRLQVRVGAPPAAQDYVPAPAIAAPMPLPVAPVIQAPSQFIEIAPTVVDTVYVPQYNPAVVYGAPLPLYTGYSYAVAPPLAVGLLGFGTAIVVAEPVWNRPWHRPWGWNSWGMHWGEPGRRWHAGEPPPPPMARPAVVYNNTTYVSRSTTVVNNTINVGQPRPMPAVNAQPQPFGPHPGALGAAALGGAALAAGALAQRPQPPVPHGGPGPWQQQPPAGQPPHLAGLVPPGQFRQPWQGGLQPGAGFAQRPSAPPGQGHAPAAESWSARQAGRNGVPQPQAQTAPVPPPQGAAAAHAPRPWMAQREQERMRVQAQPQALPPAQQRAQEQEHPQQAAMAQQRMQEQARQQQMAMAQQRSQEQAHQQQMAMAQQRAQDQARQQQMAMAQQRSQEQARQQQAAMAQQRAQEQARQQQAVMAQQRAQQQMQMQQRQEMAQRQEMQRAQQFQQQQQQMAAARAREARPPERGGVPGQHEGRWR
ncbi:MAG: DUF3300 domain-containing protein [Proteobacteria bacterium]|nr:DUF3300 domain-containing protein [Pseudomonadota bacterium]